MKTTPIYILPMRPGLPPRKGRGRAGEALGTEIFKPEVEPG